MGRGKGGNQSRDGRRCKRRTTVPCVSIQTLKEEKPLWFSDWQEDSQWQKKKKKKG